MAAGAIRTFRDLIVWRKGKEPTKSVDRATARMPRSEMFGLTSRVRRAAADYPRFLRRARGSPAALVTRYEPATEMATIRADPRVQSLLAGAGRLLRSLIMKMEAKGPDR